VGLVTPQIMNYPVGPCTSSRTVFGLPAVFHLFSTQALSTTPLLKSPIREKRLSPRRGSRQPLLPLSPKRTQVRLKSLLYLVWLTPDSFRAHGRPSGQECRLWLKRPAPNASRRCPAIAAGEAAVRSRIACQRIAGPDSSSQATVSTPSECAVTLRSLLSLRLALTRSRI
jgi:hypothetical protein